MLTFVPAAVVSAASAAPAGMIWLPQGLVIVLDGAADLDRRARGRAGEVGIVVLMPRAARVYFA